MFKMTLRIFSFTSCAVCSSYSWNSLLLLFGWDIHALSVFMLQPLTRLRQIFIKSVLSQKQQYCYSFWKYCTRPKLLFFLLSVFFCSGDAKLITIDSFGGPEVRDLGCLACRPGLKVGLCVGSVCLYSSSPFDVSAFMWVVYVYRLTNLISCIRYQG